MIDHNDLENLKTLIYEHFIIEIIYLINILSLIHLIVGIRRPLSEKCVLLANPFHKAYVLLSSFCPYRPFCVAQIEEFTRETVAGRLDMIKQYEIGLHHLSTPAYCI